MMTLGTLYDAINTAIFLPSGGSRRLRRLLVEALDVRPGHRVLELGCGTGLLTAPLLAAGAEVTALDALPAMLEAARRRAPGARFLRGDAIRTDVGGGYDRVALSFLLHNFDSGDRRRLLRRARAALSGGGRVGILEWALPAGSIRKTLWRRFLRALEPSPSVLEILDGVLEHEAPAAGLRVVERRWVAGGRAQILVLRPLE